MQDSRETSSPTRRPPSKEEKAQARGLGPGKIWMILMLADANERIYVWSCRELFFIFSPFRASNEGTIQVYTVISNQFVWNGSLSWVFKWHRGKLCLYWYGILMYSVIILQESFSNDQDCLCPHARAGFLAALYKSRHRRANSIQASHEKVSVCRKKHWPIDSRKCWMANLHPEWVVFFCVNSLKTENILAMTLSESPFWNFLYAVCCPEVLLLMCLENPLSIGPSRSGGGSIPNGTMRALRLAELQTFKWDHLRTLSWCSLSLSLCVWYPYLVN